MLRREILLGLAGAAVLGMAGCGRQVLTVQEASELPTDKLHNCIKRAAMRRRWHILRDEPGRMLLRFTKADHVLVAEVTYNDKGFTITPVKKGSTLINDDGTAHRKVNQWTNNLAQTIREEEGKVLVRQQQ